MNMNRPDTTEDVKYKDHANARHSRQKYICA